MGKMFLLAFALLFISLLTGCETAKGTAYGVHRIAAGVADDTYNTWQNLKKADRWIEDKTW